MVAHYFFLKWVSGLLQESRCHKTQKPIVNIPVYGGKLEHMGKKMSKSQDVFFDRMGLVLYSAGIRMKLRDTSQNLLRLHPHLTSSSNWYIDIILAVHMDRDIHPFFACTNMMLKSTPSFSNDRSFLINSSLKKDGLHRISFALMAFIMI